MRIVMMACTVRGFSLMRRAAASLARRMPGAEIVQEGRCARVPGYENGPRLSESTEKWFSQTDALVFFAAAGIAVRCIAPFVRDKYEDPAVLAVDEGGSFCISLLSGHVGGANRLCRILAEETGAVPVITTATDTQQRFAVDVFARRYGLHIHSREAAKRISAKVVAGEAVGVFLDEDIYMEMSAAGSGGGKDKVKFAAGLNDVAAGTMGSADSLDGFKKPVEILSKPAEILSESIAAMSGVQVTTDRAQADVLVTVWKKACDRADALYLVPRAVTAGIGCRRGASEAAIRMAVESLLRKTGIFREALSAIASIDIKKEESGLQAFAAEWALPLTFYSAGQLQEIPGLFTGSPFVERTTGVDNVCERSAVRLAREQKGRKGQERRKGQEVHKGQEVFKGHKEYRECKEHEAPVRLLAGKYCENGVTVAFAAGSGLCRE